MSVRARYWRRRACSFCTHRLWLGIFVALLPVAVLLIIILIIIITLRGRRFRLPLRLQLGVRLARVAADKRLELHAYLQVLEGVLRSVGHGRPVARPEGRLCLLRCGVLLLPLRVRVILVARHALPLATAAAARCSSSCAIVRPKAGSNDRNETVALIEPDLAPPLSCACCERSAAARTGEAAPAQPLLCERPQRRHAAVPSSSPPASSLSRLATVASYSNLP